MVLDLLNKGTELYESELYSLSMLLERGVQSSNSPIPVKLLGKARGLADQILPYSRESKEDVRVVTPENWVQPAISHPGGLLAEFYGHALSKLQQAKEADPNTVAEYVGTFRNMVSGNTYSDELSRVILASFLHFLYSVDSRWTIEEFLPLFDPATDVRRARQCLHGYLSQGRWTESMLTELLRYYELWFPLIGREPDSIRASFCVHLAGIAVYALVHPLDEGWLARFISATTAEVRTAWASQMRLLIRNLDNDAKGHLWTRWLKRYWESRLTGLPLPLDNHESAEMFEWALEMGPVFMEVVDLICQSPYPNLGDSMAYYPIANSDLLKQCPAASLKLLAFLTKNENGRPIYDLNELRNAASVLVELVPGEPAFRGLCDEMARMGVANVADLAAKLV